MIGSVYESNKEFVEKLNSVRDDFQAELLYLFLQDADTV